MQSFVCEEDSDIESFLHSKALLYEKINKGRTYIIVDEEEDQVNSNNNLPAILGYFTLALKVMQIPEKASNTLRKKLDGYKHEYKGEKISELPCYLIGQLGRSSKCSHKELPGSDILDMCYSSIQPAFSKVGGRIVMVESKTIDKVLKFYKDNNFEIISEIPDEEQPMVQLFSLALIK